MAKDRRLKLHTILQGVVGVREDGKTNLHFQPPSNIHLVYPCIIYERNDMSETRADNILYGFMNGYSITVIDPDPDSEIPEKVLALPLCSFDRHYTKDNLNHDVYNIYY